VIWDSNSWKRQLAADARYLERAMRDTTWSEDRFTALERRIFVSAYAIRKLMDSQKLSDELEGQPIRCKAYIATGMPVDVMNWDRIDQLYDFEKAVPSELSLREYCNQVVHSFVFMLRTTRRSALRGFFVASERVRKGKLYDLNIKDVIALIRATSDDDVISMTSKRDPTDGVMRIVSKSNRELPRP